MFPSRLQVSEIANAFHQALTMSDDERLRRLSCASEFVTRVTTQRWALAVMLDLKGVYKNVSPVQFSGAGLGLGFRLLGMDTGFSSLILSVWRKSSEKLVEGSSCWITEALLWTTTTYVSCRAVHYLVSFLNVGANLCPLLSLLTAR